MRPRTAHIATETRLLLHTVLDSDLTDANGPSLFRWLGTAIEQCGPSQRTVPACSSGVHPERCVQLILERTSSE
jgi:hypothetical protein